MQLSFLSRCTNLHGIGYSAINTARSALSNLITLENDMKFGEHPLVTRYMKGIFEIRPALPKYSEIWDVTVVLNYLKTFVMVTALPLKELTLKLTMLLCLTTGQRGQTIHKMEVSGIQALPDRCRITINDKLKHTNPESIRRRLTYWHSLRKKDFVL